MDSDVDIREPMGILNEKKGKVEVKKRLKTQKIKGNVYSNGRQVNNADSKGATKQKAIPEVF